MRILSFFIILAALLTQGCKKNNTLPGDSAPSPTPPSASSNFKKIKETRSVDNYTATGYGPRMSQTKYIYNSAGQLSELHFLDSSYANSVWSVSTSSLSFNYNINGKISALTTGTLSVNYVYDANNNVKYEISGTDTTKYVTNGNQVVSIRIGPTNDIIKSYYTQNLDSTLSFNQSNTLTARNIYTRNNTLDLRWAYLNQFVPLIEDYNETIKRYDYPTGSYPAIKNYTLAYDSNNYPIKQTSAIDYETYAYY
ncbi:MAG: hypothetical protein H0W61_13200 [Bacteroidetes bacterium]|nr:hypothetical protein [Bacteroidota bacterium]